MKMILIMKTNKNNNVVIDDDILNMKIFRMIMILKGQSKEKINFDRWIYGTIMGYYLLS